MNKNNITSRDVWSLLVASTGEPLDSRLGELTLGKSTKEAEAAAAAAAALASATFFAA